MLGNNFEKEREVSMFAVFVDDGFDSVFETLSEAKEYARSCREDGAFPGNRKTRAYVKKLTRAKIQMLDL